jgi:multiple sugar transport system substrate-binding protein
MRAQSLSRVVLAVLITLLLSACGGAPASQQVTLTYAYPDDSQSSAAATALIEAYTAANPQVRIQAQPLPANDYQQQLLSRIESGAPDLFVSLDTQVPALIKRDALLNLRPLLGEQAGLKTDDFQSVALDIWARGDALYGLPAEVVPQIMFYNRDLFDASGLAYPIAGWTWNDWLDLSKKLTVTDGGQVSRYGTALSSWGAMVWGNGGELISPDGKQTLLDRPEAAAGVQFAADMVNVHKVAPPPTLVNGPDPVALFKQQQVAMLPGLSSLATNLLDAKLPFQWGIAPLPTGVEPATALSVSGLAVSAKTANQDAALDFLAWSVGPDGNKIKESTTPFAAPALRSAGARPNQVAGSDAIMQAIQHGRTLPPVEQWPEIAVMVNDALIPVFEGQQTASVAYARVAPNINALLAGA